MRDNGQRDYTIVIAGGGTGGHLFPGIALAERFAEEWQARVVFIGTSYGLEHQILPKTPYEFHTVWMRGLQRRITLSNLLFPIRLLVSVLQCAVIYRSVRPDAVVGTGGYVSAPALTAALIAGIPTAIQEQNSFPGLVNRLLGKHVDQVHLTFEDSRRYFEGQKNLVLSGNPVRAKLNLAGRQPALAQFGLSEGKTTLFVFGGSQGARGINEALLAALPELQKLSRLQILWATGRSSWQRIAERIDDADFVKAYEFIEDMASAYAAADFLLCRSGASTLSEIALTGLPAILVPFPQSAGGHQEKNARSVEQAGAATVILESELNTDRLVAEIGKLAGDEGRRRDMSKASAGLARPDAAIDIVNSIMNHIRKTNEKKSGVQKPASAPGNSH